MKTIKRITFILIVLIASVGIIFKDKITAYAEEFKIEDILVNKVYKKGDNIIIFDGKNGSLSLILYEDKDGSLIHFYLPITIGSGVYPLSEIVVGYNCQENMIEYRGQEYNNEEEKQELLNSHKSTCDFSGFTSEENDILETIERWQVVENDIEKINEYILEATDKNPNFEVYIPLEELIKENKVITFREYVEPEFTLECNQDKVKYGEILSCNLNLTTTDVITEIKTTLNIEHFELQDIKPSDGWEIEQDSDGYYILKNEKGFKGNDAIFELKLLATDNIDVLSEINLNDMKYTNSFGEEEQTKAESPIEIESIEEKENPNTTDAAIIVTIILFIITGIFTVKIHHKKKVLS